jgi:3-oxoacyl-[acyl-carrier protein] reductase
VSPLLTGKAAIVTGGGNGIGRAIAEGLADAGAAVTVADIDGAASSAVSRAVEGAGGRAIDVAVDVQHEESARAMVDDAIEAFGRVDILVNCAAIVLRFMDPPTRPWDSWTSGDWDAYFAVNVRGTWNACRAAVPAMRSAGKGKIVNFSSQAVFWGPPNLAAYTSSKAAIIGFTRSLARELGGERVYVNAVTPGLILTDEVRARMSGDYAESQTLATALGRLGEPNDLVGPVKFLTSDLSDFITGQVLNVDGGMVLY